MSQPPNTSNTREPSQLSQSSISSFQNFLGSEFTCSHCFHRFSSDHGLKIHIGRKHPEFRIHPSVSQPDPFSPSSLAVSDIFPDLLAQLKVSLPTLRHCPKGARIQLAQYLSSAFEDCLSLNSTIPWYRLLCLPYIVLQAPLKSNKCNASFNVTKFVKNNILIWNAIGKNEVPILLLQEKLSIRNPKPHVVTKQNNLHLKIEAKVAEGDITGAIRLLCSDDTLAPFNQSTLSLLKEKHPDHPTPEVFPEDPNSVPLVGTVEEIQKAIFSFPAGSAGGLDAFRPQILKELSNIQSSVFADSFLNSLTNVCNLMLAGKIPADVCPLIYGASLTALNKKTGGIRPIAVGNTLRRLTGKVACFKIAQSLGVRLQPKQLGFAVKGGVEAGAHAARKYFNFSHDQIKVFLKVDFLNAFNMIRRDKLLQQVSSKLPELFPFINQCYREPSLLFHGTNQLLSKRGVQQGDPLGPALFCSIIQPIVESLDAELNVWFLDDASIADTPSKVLNNFQKIIRDSELLGLELNFSKCELAILGDYEDTEYANILKDFSDLAPGIQTISKNKAFLLGAPLSDDAIAECLASKTVTLIKFAERLSEISAHSAYFLLKHSLGIPRLVYFLRCSPAWRNFEQLHNYDDILKKTLESITNAQMDTPAWQQASLPVKMGGLGIRHTIDLAIPSFLASSFSVDNLMSAILPGEIYSAQDTVIDDVLSRWSSICQSELPPSDVRGFQRSWEQPLFEALQTSLYENSTSPENKARLLAVSLKEAGAWLNALPSPVLGTHLDNSSFRVAAALRLGCKICEPHLCLCDNSVNESGHHGLCCKLRKGRRSRHEAVNDIIKRALCSAEVPSIREPPGCSRSDGKRPDGMTLVPWSRGKCLVWDFTCVDTFTSSYLSETSNRCGAAAELAEKKKTAKYRSMDQNFIFMPVAVESMGCFGSQALSFIKTIGQKIALVSGDQRSTSYLIQRISIAVQRGNVASILGSIPFSSRLDEIFYL